MSLEWKVAGIVGEGSPIKIEGLNVWDHKWMRISDTILQLQHPTYSAQMHCMSVFQIEISGLTVEFAAGEVSANVWTFYVRNNHLTESHS